MQINVPQADSQNVQASFHGVVKQKGSSEALQKRPVKFSGSLHGFLQINSISNLTHGNPELSIRHTFMLHAEFKIPEVPQSV